MTQMQMEPQSQPQPQVNFLTQSHSGKSTQSSSGTRLQRQSRMQQQSGTQQQVQMQTQAKRPNEEKALEALKHFFGYSSFRPGQSSVVESILLGNDVLGVMPTGAGKSICYQIPAILLPGVTMVISPLISLMQDQVDALNDAGIPAAFINTTQTVDEQSMVLAQVKHGDIRLLYVTPERLETERFRQFAAQIPIALVTVDEAHCVSQWGQDFRSSYLGIEEFIHSLPQRPRIAAFTATATSKVRFDIVRLLGLRNPRITVTGFDRPNLYFDVIAMPKKAKSAWIIDYVKSHGEDSGIIYCATRKETEALAQELNDCGIAAVAYHGGLSSDVRNAAQRDFVTDRIPVVVATNAFGMGIDKSNVRFVIHHNMPQSIEAYYQEAGRAGRDGEPSRCTLLWNESDIVTRLRLLDTDNDNERMNAEAQEIVRAGKRRLLDAMIGYCRTTACLHRYMTRYFEDSTVREPEEGGMHNLGQSHKCGNCSNCEGTVASVDVTEIARAISKCVHDLGQSFGMGKIVAVLRGAKTQELITRHLDTNPSFGVLKDTPQATIRDVLSQMATDGFLFVSEGRLPIVRFGSRAALTAAPDFHYEMKRIERKSSTKLSSTGTGSSTYHRSEAAGGAPSSGVNLEANGDEVLFQRLRAMRTQIASEIGKPPYIVFSDKTLHDMARIKPLDDAQFLSVNGVGENKLNQYGKRFIEIVTDYCSEGVSHGS